MYATTCINQITGISSGRLTGRSFYDCIAQHCSSTAFQCLESAKSNNSITYMRFFFRNPCRIGLSRPSYSNKSESKTITNVVSDLTSSTGLSNRSSMAPLASSSLPASSDCFDPSNALIELEAFVSCTSDGLVVCLRRAAP
jgi:hypothetical protein